MANWLHISAVLLALVAASSAIDANGNIKPASPETQTRYTEGDLIGCTEGPTLTWPDARIPYRICIHITEEYAKIIRKIFDIIEEHTCIRFIPRPKDDSNQIYLNITGYPNLGCFSYLGYQGNIQKCNLQMDPIGIGCFRDGVPLHLILHALGLRHMHNDHRRDEFIDIISDNISRKNLNKLKKNPPEPGPELKYDLDSAMHFGRKAFSKNCLDTIEPKDGKATIGIKNQLSDLDIQRLNILYKCKKKD